MSSADASNMSAARSLAMSRTRVAARRVATPPVCRDRDPNVPMPLLTTSVSDWMNSTSSMESPSFSATSIDHAVAWPWPWEDVPVFTTALPSGLTSTELNSASSGPPLVIST